MQLPYPVTIQPPPITRNNGEVRTYDQLTLSELDFTIIDNSKRKQCLARIYPCPFHLVLWRDDDYDAVGDYTQDQAESRVLELLGPDIKAGLEALFVFPQQSTN